MQLGSMGSTVCDSSRSLRRPSASPGCGENSGADLGNEALSASSRASKSVTEASLFSNKSVQSRFSVITLVHVSPSLPLPMGLVDITLP